ncbi:hypothetical protein J7T55_002585 [Diaporthe amygdali]|uniref:uncharacterized protein n=1 Tax=Phomopsis amygdali TaxID=1214568 RepID=UPI0022FDCE0A|nr:uncharacterized protein J7T55_002585 [Diaporthe amygdali]KAJ0122074.1 hypothetical protein J7T55_002585 [Diaporthe amygdali]
MLHHYVPHIVENFKFTTAIRDVILLPDSIKLVTNHSINPIMVGLKRRAMEWTGGLGGLERFINTMDQELLQGHDRELLSGAWAVYEGRIQAKRSGNASSRKA